MLKTSAKKYLLKLQSWSLLGHCQVQNLTTVSLLLNQSHVKEHGGKQIYGWCIHVWKKVMIEAEFHCIWETPDGKLIDITPKKERGKEIVFIPDPEKIYNGQQVNNIRKPIATDQDIKRFIELFEEYFRIINEGELEDKHGYITINTEEFHKLAKEMVSIESKLRDEYGNQRVLY